MSANSLWGTANHTTPWPFYLPVGFLPRNRLGHNEPRFGTHYKAHREEPWSREKNHFVPQKMLGPTQGSNDCLKNTRVSCRNRPLDPPRALGLLKPVASPHALNYDGPAIEPWGFSRRSFIKMKKKNREKVREGEGEKHRCERETLPASTLSGNGAHNPGMWPFGLRDHTKHSHAGQGSSRRFWSRFIVSSKMLQSRLQNRTWKNDSPKVLIVLCIKISLRAQNRHRQHRRHSQHFIYNMFFSIKQQYSWYIAMHTLIW